MIFSKELLKVLRSRGLLALEIFADLIVAGSALLAIWLFERWFRALEGRENPVLLGFIPPTISVRCRAYRRDLEARVPVLEGYPPMTTDANRLGPPFTFAEAASWFVRNLLEAFIWATTGAIVLVLAFAAGRYPLVAICMLLILFAAGGLAWRVLGGRRSVTSKSIPHANGRHFDLRVRIFHLDIRVIGETRGDLRQDQL